MNPLRTLTPGPDTHEVQMKHILVVDDDPEILQSYKAMLEANDFLVSTHSNGVDALKLVMQMDVDAVFCDLMMPTMAGDMFYLAVQRVKPQVCKRFIFVTGYEGHPRFEEFIKKERPVVLYKPVTLGKMLGTLKVLFSKASLVTKAA